MRIANLSFVLLLLCTCAAVNLLFYTLQNIPLEDNQTEHFIVLKPEEETSSRTSLSGNFIIKHLVGHHCQVILS
jgi:hypothetical protein